MASSDERHPIVAGLIALVSVSVAVALIVGISAFAAAHVLHIGGGGSGSGNGAGASLYLPEPSPTLTNKSPLVTLSSEPTQTATGSSSASASPHKSGSPAKKQDKQINLTAGEVSVSPMQTIDLTGTYDGGEGHLLRVQRKSGGGGWEDFPVPDVDVSGGQFSTSVETGRTGKQMFRMKDVDTGDLSNAVTVQVG